MDGDRIGPYHEAMLSATLDLVIFQQKNTQSADVIYIGAGLVPATLDSTGNPETVRLSHGEHW
jgi:hypothetical protein